MNTKARSILQTLLLWGLALVAAKALAQENSIDAFEVTQVGGKVVVRVTTKEPLRSVPPNFAVASPARIAFDFPNTANALGRSSQDIAQGELRSMNVVQGPDRTRLVLNLRRPVVHESALDGRNLVITLSEPAVAQAKSPGVAHFAEGKPDAVLGGEGRALRDERDRSRRLDHASASRSTSARSASIWCRRVKARKLSCGEAR